MKFLILFLYAISTNVIAAEIYGYYSNINSTLEEPSGYEVLFINNGQPGRDNISVLFQRFEGWPKPPELLKCYNCASGAITFESKVMGKFKGKVLNGALVGEFVDIGYSLNLPKPPSIWQRY